MAEKKPMYGGFEPLVVYGRSGAHRTYYGQIEIHGVQYPLTPATRLIKLFFCVTNTTRGKEWPGNKTYYLDPSTYYACIDPWPTDDDTYEPDAEWIAAWKERHDSFVAKHSEWFANRDAILAATGKYERPLTGQSPPGSAPVASH